MGIEQTISSTISVLITLMLQMLIKKFPFKADKFQTSVIIFVIFLILPNIIDFITQILRLLCTIPVSPVDFKTAKTAHFVA